MTQSNDLKNAEKNPETPQPLTASSTPLPAGPGALSGIKQPRQVLSETLLHGDRELQIIHGDEIYRLSVTRQGKLILHK